MKVLCGKRRDNRIKDECFVGSASGILQNNTKIIAKSARVIDCRHTR
jgi:hypothetical protein